MTTEVVPLTAAFRGLSDEDGDEGNPIEEIETDPSDDLNEEEGDDVWKEEGGGKEEESE